MVVVKCDNFTTWYFDILTYPSSTCKFQVDLDLWRTLVPPLQENEILSFSINQSGMVQKWRENGPEMVVAKMQRPTSRCNFATTGMSLQKCNDQPLVA